MGFTKENIMVHNRFEITLLEPLVQVEALVIIMEAENKRWNLVVNQTGRILTIEGPKTIKPVIKFLANIGLGPDVGLIKKITEYEPDQYEKEFTEYIPIDEL